MENADSRPHVACLLCQIPPYQPVWVCWQPECFGLNRGTAVKTEVEKMYNRKQQQKTATEGQRDTNEENQ